MGLLDEVSTTDIFEDIMDEMRSLYLQDSKPWVILWSTGKDSSLVLALTWQMLLDLPENERHKMVYVVCTDTKVEEPEFTEFVTRSVESVRTAAKEQGLPIEMHFGKPEIRDSFFFQVIGKGNTPPTKLSRFRWCTDKLKIKTADLVVERILMEHGTEMFSADKHDVMMVLGVRESESENRKQSIRKFAIGDKFARHAKHDRALVYHPIKYVEVGDLWSYLLSLDTLPWGIETVELYSIYKDSSGECPMTQVAGKQNNSCGGGRMGCWTCNYVGKNDKMLVNLIQSGNNNLIPLLEYKQMMYDMRLDIRFRDPLRRMERTRIMRPAPVSNPFGQVSLFGEPADSEYDQFKRADDWKFEPGPITLEGRKILLQSLMFIQQQTGYMLIEQEEVEAILEAWQEDGYTLTGDELTPVKHEYPGPILLEKDTAQLNMKGTTNPNPIFEVWEEFSMGQNEVIEFLKKRGFDTGRNLFYFMGCSDYHRDFKMSTDDPIVNHVQFIVCESDITSQEEARKFVDDWLGYNDVPGEQVNWERFGETFFLNTMAYAESPDCDTERLAYMNQSLVALGLEPVNVPEYVPLLAG